MTTQHTATPWGTQPTAGNHQHLIWAEDGKTIAVVYTDAEDAALIVRAVNSHAALVEAGELIIRHTERWGLTTARKNAYEKLTAALKLAKGEA